MMMMDCPDRGLEVDFDAEGFLRVWCAQCRSTDCVDHATGWVHIESVRELMPACPSDPDKAAKYLNAQFAKGTEPSRTLAEFIQESDDVEMYMYFGSESVSLAGKKRDDVWVFEPEVDFRERYECDYPAYLAEIRTRLALTSRR
jgi:hypothetical protein